LILRARPILFFLCVKLRVLTHYAVWGNSISRIIAGFVFMVLGYFGLSSTDFK